MYEITWDNSDEKIYIDTTRLNNDGIIDISSDNKTTIEDRVETLLFKTQNVDTTPIYININQKGQSNLSLTYNIQSR